MKVGLIINIENLRFKKHDNFAYKDIFKVNLEKEHYNLWRINFFVTLSVLLLLYLHFEQLFSYEICPELVIVAK